MKALYKMHTGADGIILKDNVAVPEPEEDEVRIKIHYCGICGTDIHIMHDEFKCKMPIIIGHEFSGVIDAVGTKVKDFKKGDRVVSMTVNKTCETCVYCAQGYLMLCKDRQGLGTRYDGAFAEYFVIKENRVFHLPDNVSMKEAALCEVLGCTIRGVIERTTVKPGDYVYVSGPGTIGQLVSQLAKLSGAHVTVAGTDVDADRLKLAKELGADVVIDVTKENVQQRATEITHGDLYDVVFECAGSAPSAATCMEIVKREGCYSQVGLFGKSIPFDMDTALKNEVSITNTYSAAKTTWLRMMRLLEQGKINVKPFISEVLTLDEWAAGFKKAENKEGCKILLKCSDDID